MRGDEYVSKMGKPPYECTKEHIRGRLTCRGRCVLARVFNVPEGQGGSALLPDAVISTFRVNLLLASPTNHCYFRTFCLIQRWIWLGLHHEEKITSNHCKLVESKVAVVRLMKELRKGKQQSCGCRKHLSLTFSEKSVAVTEEPPNTLKCKLVRNRLHDHENQRCLPVRQMPA
ncbi:hypothetical protein KIN20_005123 [Parelaphostrongylus tenuis]|uniref:Uncharacterized protein n=1 Tax=Parelaphostrongylus tenuis TaxID=148309 RepID=A0AAD5MKW6_PARTN|nr:hypothetical protein KIN20_005123 [Parelaphostrongylus tenuis]